MERDIEMKIRCDLYTVVIGQVGNVHFFLIENVPATIFQPGEWLFDIFQEKYLISSPHKRLFDLYTGKSTSYDDDDDYDEQSELHIYMVLITMVLCRNLCLVEACRFL
jgi:hypothetical protein